LFLVLSGAGYGAGSDVAEYRGRDLADRALLDELFRAERFFAEFLLDPGNEAYHRKGRAAGLEEVVIAVGDGQPQLSTYVDNPPLDRGLTALVARLTHLLTHGKWKTIDSAVNEAIVVELICAGHEHVAESLETGRATELFERVGIGVYAY